MKLIVLFFVLKSIASSMYGQNTIIELINQYDCNKASVKIMNSLKDSLLYEIYGELRDTLLNCEQIIVPTLKLDSNILKEKDITVIEKYLKLDTNFYFAFFVKDDKVIGSIYRYSRLKKASHFSNYGKINIPLFLQKALIERSGEYFVLREFRDTVWFINKKKLKVYVGRKKKILNSKRYLKSDSRRIELKYSYRTAVY